MDSVQQENKFASRSVIGYHILKEYGGGYILVHVYYSDGAESCLSISKEDFFNFPGFHQKGTDE